MKLLAINFKYFRVGIKSLLHGAPNMDSLISIGSGAAVIYGVYALYKIAFGLGHGDFETAHHFMMNLYFESAGMILTLITFGKTLEARAKRKTSDAISKLMDLSPKTATVLRDGKELLLSVDEVLVGDLLIVKAGEAFDAVPATQVATVDGACGMLTKAMNETEAKAIAEKLGDKLLSVYRVL